MYGVKYKNKADKQVQPLEEPKVATGTWWDSIVRYLFFPVENRVALKMLHSKTVLVNEFQRQMGLDYFIIHPCSRFKTHWEIFIMVVLAINMVILPVELAFFHRVETIEWITINTVSSLFFFADIIINFYSGIFTMDGVRLDRSFIARTYLKSWFIIDVLGAAPCDVMLAWLDQVEHISRYYDGFRLWVQVLGCLKLLRVVSLIRHISQWEQLYFSTSKRFYVKLLNYLLLMLLLAHVNGCLLYFVPCNIIQGPSWVSRKKIKNMSWQEKYVMSLYSAITLMMGVGFGESTPHSISEAVLSTFIMTSGIICYTIILANGTALVQNLNHSRTCHEKMMAEVQEYMKYKRLPVELQEQVTDYFESRFRGRYFDEHVIIHQLSDCLRESVVKHNCFALIEKVPFLASSDSFVLSEIMKRLRSEFFQPGDLIIASGTIGKKMYFLQSGNVSELLRDGTIVRQFNDGSFFGELCLLRKTEKQKLCSIAESYCTVYSLSVGDFEEILEMHPEMREVVEREAKTREEEQEANRLRILSSLQRERRFSKYKI